MLIHRLFSTGSFRPACWPSTVLAAVPAACLAVPLLWAVALAAGCQQPEPGPDAVPDASAAVDLASAAADLASGPDLLPRCELPYDQRAINMVSTGVVTVAVDPGDPDTHSAQVDATAGGSMSYSKNPFVYLDLIAGKKAELTDVQAAQSGAWDIAFKRWQVKLNGGDSGPGGVGAALVPGKDLAEVKTAPAGPYAEDSYFDAKCQVQLDPIGGLQTVLSDWYDYDGATMKLVPKKQVIVLPRRDQKGHIKVQITEYYKGMTGANFTLSWSLLP